MAAVAALVALSAAPSYATTRTGSATVQWTTSVSAAMSINTNYTSGAGAGAAGSAQPATIYNLAAPPAGSTCTPSGSAFSNGVVDFGTFSPPSVAAQFSCLYSQAINAQVTTASINWTLTEAISANPSNSFLLCMLPNTGASWPSTPSTTAGAGRTNAVTGAACPAGTGLVSGTPITMVSAATTAFAPGSPANVGEDTQVIIPSSPTAGAQAPLTITFTLVAS